ncbi:MULTISPECIES: hypothetical protein [Synechocystis]|uniref:Uncharacterized protein n=1 Tax=Synechocystis salina LEGE 00031 TaxID=1828736 RepID=A0ABR9VUV8_9SYNC|nr:MULTISPECIES: hypothetical protein [Synechocystis]MBD2652133.1 hypothetical protein [Synechocystis sp. FACHB-383]MBE9242007.1 hypothetical protein [Synechocystis salina LEGE 00041]MBE9255134.1 hypothetical protein [Synechocystis salina LEGE 00031]
MNPEFHSPLLPAPCVIEQGILVNKEDMQRVLNDLGQVNYYYQLDGKSQAEGQGWILDVFSDAQQATIVTNQSLYLNVNSFDYLEISLDHQGKTIVDLWQESRHLRLVPLDDWLNPREGYSQLMPLDLEEAVAEVLAARLDVQRDEEDF